MTIRIIWLAIILVSGFCIQATISNDPSLYDSIHCERTAALLCEDSYRNCKDNNIANDTLVNCKCNAIFYGTCLQKARCFFAKQVDPLVRFPDVYMRKCISSLEENNCPDPSSCYVPCSATNQFNPSTDTVLPFNNYSPYFLRVRICSKSHNAQILSELNLVRPGICADTDYTICPTWIPPSTFTLVTLPLTTQYLTIDYCAVNGTSATCAKDNPAPSVIYGHQLQWIESFDTPLHLPCAVDTDCLGSFCDTLIQPPRCAPKSSKHVGINGARYSSDPFEL